MKQTEIMLDLETMSTKRNAAIMAIGAAEMDFEKGEIVDTFYVTVDLVSSFENGGHICPIAVKWWLRQKDDARYGLLTDSIPITAALIRYQQWLESKSQREQLIIWGNGVTFDNVIIDNTILRDAFERLEWQCPWPSWNDMCYRTMQSMYPEVKATKRIGVAHNALDDAKSQALHLIEIMERKNEQY